MSWFLSLILVGAVVTTGNNIPNYEYQNATVVNNPKTIKKTHGDVTDKFEKTYPFNSKGKIEVSNINGSIYIEAWDRPEIQLEATKVASTAERLTDVQVKVEDSQNNFRVRTNYKRTNYKHGKKYKYNKLYVTFRLKVPRTALLDEIETVNGSVTVSNMTNYTEVSAVNGSVKASNLRGTAKLSTVNGSVYADFDQLDRNSAISLGSVNGSVKLGIPSNTNATVKADTLNGSIRNDFGLPVRKGKYVGRDLYGRIGSGNVKIKLSSVNGGLSITNKDGGTTNPAVNLLKQKTSDDFDDSFETRMTVNTGQMNIQIDKSVSQARKASEIARRERQTQRRIDRDKRRIERDKQRKLHDIERRKHDVARAKADAKRHKIDAKRHKLNKERLKEIETERERVEESMVRASEALYMTRRSPFMQEKTGSFEVKGAPKVIIDADDCDVVVRGWDKQEVKYTIARMTRTGNRTKDLRTRISSNKSKVEIEVTNDISPSANSNKMINRVKVEVFVPKKSNLKVSSNQEIRLEGVSGELELNGSTGSINVRDSYGRLKAESIDGTIRIIGFKGEVETIAVDSDVYLEGDFKKIRSESKDGSVYLTLPDNANATLVTNGEIDIEDVRLENVINVQKNKTKTFNIGKGGAKYDFDFVDGTLIVRSKSSLTSD